MKPLRLGTSNERGKNDVDELSCQKQLITRMRRLGFLSPYVAIQFPLAFRNTLFRRKFVWMFQTEFFIDHSERTQKTIFTHGLFNNQQFSRVVSACKKSSSFTVCYDLIGNSTLAVKFAPIAKPFYSPHFLAAQLIFNLKTLLFQPPRVSVPRDTSNARTAPSASRKSKTVTWRGIVPTVRMNRIAVSIFSCRPMGIQAPRFVFQRTNSWTTGLIRCTRKIRTQRTTISIPPAVSSFVDVFDFFYRHLKTCYKTLPI